MQYHSSVHNFWYIKMFCRICSFIYFLEEVQVQKLLSLYWVVCNAVTCFISAATKYIWWIFLLEVYSTFCWANFVFILFDVETAVYPSWIRFFIFMCTGSSNKTFLHYTAQISFSCTTFVWHIFHWKVFLYCEKCSKCI